MKTKKLILTSLIALFAVTTSMSLMAQGGNMHKGNGNGDCMGSGMHCKGMNMQEGKFINMLDLSEEQQAKVETLRTQHMAKMLPLKNQMQEKQARLNTISTQKDVDMKAVNTLIDEIGVIKVTMMKEKESHRQEIRKILTEDQRVKFDMHQGQKGGRGHGCGK